MSDMSLLNGKWKLVAVDNAVEYYKAIGTAAEHIAQAERLLTPENNIVQEIEIVGNNVTLKLSVPGKVLEVRAVIGETTTVPFLDGRILKTVYELDGNKLLEKQSGGFVSNNTRYLEGNHLIYEQVAETGVSSTRKYIKL
ncbi:sodium/calcium exchanger regulatory protein 1-like [Dreissena polymorpha]|uniref:Uncharacterized protein n=1 Tax=Dreissena polymorpha TaxID=45954 RepID=A0A9D3Y3I4_DREPO|nr:sodium/calcium exchanger regulatory protein 1-like [Dreissena polymorpha]KAH3691130.1 hypothetical protein DPMN_194090 [Dreissena polymorpha]